MRILFITISWPGSGEHNIYSDLIDEFVRREHEVTVISVQEEVPGGKSSYRKHTHRSILKIRSGKIQKRNKYMKVLCSLFAGVQILGYSLRYLRKSRFDLILFHTPPITLSPAVILLKHFYHAKLYLLLKDIWPQDAVDLGAMRRHGIVHFGFRCLEQMTYRCSDYIGCMSPGNVRYVRKKNPYLKSRIVEECPNSFKLCGRMENDKLAVRNRYQIPEDKTVVVFGGNLGRAQGVDFLIQVLRHYQSDPHWYFLMIGAGTEYRRVKQQIAQFGLKNAQMMPWMKCSDFEELVGACDIGLLLLDQRNTVPNFPSRFLTYLKAAIPILAAVDDATDIGDIIEEHNCGVQSAHGNLADFDRALNKLSEEEQRAEMGKNAFSLYLNQYTSEKSYQIIMKHFKEGVLDE